MLLFYFQFCELPFMNPLVFHIGCLLIFFKNFYDIWNFIHIIYIYYYRYYAIETN